MSAFLRPFDSAELEYGERYEVSSFRKRDNTTELLFEANSIEIIAEPSRLVKVESSDADGLNSTTLTLSTLALYPIEGAALKDGHSYSLN
ncbi:hypothetical protein BLNAU_5915 [Blattamonas nauphoetae]|uniref:Uncharacterized protein n=1 Tax=Blattamonas nauphoetae TaxID=2049346 RepID=A0ABQ9XJG1_9EUKA|nr:hypothetical protein BLNAU_13625 [Blattamonas nauphoetae]KAK2959120.1 hypothetical protein BLNAU_5915 [Blattamonas nauphoetae]